MSGSDLQGQWMPSSVTEEGIHRPCRSEPDIIEGPKRLNLELWVLELEARGAFN